MKNANTCATNLASLLKKIGQTPPPPSSSDDDPLKALVMSFLMWETTAVFRWYVINTYSGHGLRSGDLSGGGSQRLAGLDAA